MGCPAQRAETGKAKEACVPGVGQPLAELKVPREAAQAHQDRVDVSPHRVRHAVRVLVAREHQGGIRSVGTQTIALGSC